MTKPTIPDVGSKGTYKFIDPFKSAHPLSEQIIYTCRSVRSISDLISSNEDLDELIYTPLKMTDKTKLQAIKTEDLKKDRLIVTLQSEIGNWLYVPINYIESYPSSNGIPYVYRNITITTPPIPASEDISGLVDALRAKIKASVGVEPKGKVLVLDAPEVVSYTEISDQTVIRDIARDDGSELKQLLDIQERIRVADAALVAVENAVLKGFSATSSIVRLLNPHVLDYHIDPIFGNVVVNLDDFHSSNKADTHERTTWMLALNGKIVTSGESILDLKVVEIPTYDLTEYAYDLKVTYISSLGSIMASDWTVIELPPPSINAPTLTAALNTGVTLTISMSTSGCVSYKCALSLVTYSIMSPTGVTVELPSTDGENEMTWTVPTSPAPTEGNWVVVAKYKADNGLISEESNIVEIPLIVETVKPILKLGLRWTKDHEVTRDLIDCILSVSDYASMYLDSLIETIWEGVDLNGESVVFSNKDKITFTNTIDALPTADFKAVTIRVTLVTKYGKVVASDSSTIQTTHLTFRYSDTSGMNASYFSVTSDPYSMLFNKFEAMKDGKPVWFFYTDAQCKLEFTDGTNKYMLAESSGIWSAKDTTACKTRVDDIKSKGTTMVDSDSLPTWMHSSQPVNTGLDILNTLTATLIYTGPSALLTGVYVKEVITPKP